MLFRWFCAVLLLVFASAAHVVDAAYPDRPIRLIVPFAPGGNMDITARTVAPGLTEQLGQPIVVENRGGAGGRIGNEVAAKAAPDGYTLLLGSSNAMTINQAFSAKPTYDAVKDFAPTSLVSVVPMLLVTHPSLPVKTLQEFIALAKASPGSVLMASAGTGSNTHLSGELFQVITGVKLTHVPYKGTGPALVDLMGGQTHCIFDQVSTSVPLVSSGKLRAIAVAAKKRSPLLAAVPTMAQSGVPGFEASAYAAILLPAATPKDIVNRVYTALLKVLDQPATRDAFNRMGAEVIKSTPEELSALIAGDLAKWKKVQQQTGIKLD
jgi:tripartite-type tricarboxylate transporter receptor subunit TctC